MLVGGREVLDPQIDMDLLRRCAVGPVGRDVVWLELDPDPRLTVDHYHVPVILGIDGAAEHSGPEAALGCEVRGVKDDHLMVDAHRAVLSSLPFSAGGASPTLP